ncbi:MAG: ribonuclease P protein component [Synergistales bacterium]|nr:ribonuclease P protein component [Synergistales bacterium]
MYRFPGSARLKKGWQFDYVFRHGSVLRGGQVRILYVRSPDDTTRYGTVVGKRVGKAVWRSRGKRMLRETARHLLPRTMQGYWIVLSLRRSGLRRKSSEIEHEVGLLLQKEALLTPCREEG